MSKHLISAIAMASVFMSVSSFAAKAEKPAAAKPAKSSEVKIDLGTGTPKDKEAMVYSKDKLNVKAGAAVTLTFKNNTASKGMTHNWILVKPGKAQAVRDASIAAGPDKGWVADSADVLVKSKLIDAGESEVITFTAPTEPGDYPFICTFPGHTTMTGVLKVTK